MNWIEDWLFGNKDTRRAYKYRKKMYRDIDEDLKEIARTRNSEFPVNEVTIIKKYSIHNPKYFRIYFFLGNRGYVLIPSPWGLSYEVHFLFGGYTSGRYWRHSYLDDPYIAEWEFETNINILFKSIEEFVKNNIIKTDKELKLTNVFYE